VAFAERRWRFYKTATGRALAKEELEGLKPVSARAGLEELMKRFRRGDDQLKPREFTRYKGGVLALKYSEEHNEYRCYFGQEGEGDYILLALSFTKKRKDKPDLAVPLERLADWRAQGRARRRLADARKRSR
jgi:phage-related protein